MKHAIQRALAQQDIRLGLIHYLSVATPEVATDFVLELDACMLRIERFPGAGSPRYAELLDLDGLRCVVVDRFPYLIFYFERDDYVDVVRVLHQHRDIPGLLSE